MGHRVVDAHPTYEQMRSEVAKLDRYYVPTRYPNGRPEGGDPSESFDLNDAEGAIAAAGRALAFARLTLGIEG